MFVNDDIRINLVLHQYGALSINLVIFWLCIVLLLNGREVGDDTAMVEAWHQSHVTVGVLHRHESGVGDVEFLGVVVCNDGIELS